MAVEEIFEAATRTIVKADKDQARELVEQAVAEGIDPLEMMNKGFIPGINEVGDRFGKGTLFLPELIMSAEAMQVATDAINKILDTGTGSISAGKVLIATVEGDVHDIGKTIVVSLFKANGFDVLDLGRDVAVDRIIEEAQRFEADIIGTSALLTTTMVQQKVLEQTLTRAGLKGRFKTMVGGAPCTQRWANRIGADAFAEDAAAGVKKAKALISVS
jgi:trimethylamine corrinoid protein